MIDSPAGLENLNRRITSNVNDVFDILDHSKKSLDHVKRAFKIAKEVDMKFDNFYLVGGYRFPAELGKQAEADLKFKFLGKIAEDEQLDDYVLNGKSLLDLPSDNKAYAFSKGYNENAWATFSKPSHPKCFLHNFSETFHFCIDRDFFLNSGKV